MPSYATWPVAMFYPSTFKGSCFALFFFICIPIFYPTSLVYFCKEWRPCPSRERYPSTSRPPTNMLRSLKLRALLIWCMWHASFPIHYSCRLTGKRVLLVWRTSHKTLWGVSNPHFQLPLCCLLRPTQEPPFFCSDVVYVGLPEAGEAFEKGYAVLRLGFIAVIASYPSFFIP